MEKSATKDPLTFRDSFELTKHIKSNLVYGRLIERPDFSLVMPIYGRGRFLERALENVASLNTAGLRVQLIISDNKAYQEPSEKNAIIQIIEKLNFNNCAYYLSEEPLGQNNNFNRAIALSPTKYLAMLHDDDLLVPDFFRIAKICLAFLTTAPKVGMLHQQMAPFYTESEIKNNPPKNITIYKVTKTMVSLRGFSGLAFPTCGCIYNKEAVLAAGGYNPDFYASGDAFLGLLMQSKGFVVYQLTNQTGWYRISDNTSLRTDICKQFIKEDEMFRDSWTKRYLSAKLLLGPKRRLLYSSEIDAKINTFSKLNPEITVDVLDYKKRHKRYHKWAPIKVFSKFTALFYRLLISIHLRKIGSLAD